MRSKVSAVEDYRLRLKQIEEEFNFDESDGAPRFQLPADVTYRESFDYALKYGIKHAIELKDALGAVSTHLERNVHVLDIGCGAALTASVVREAGISVKSYCGVDHAPAQVWLARLLNPGSNFMTDLAVVPMIREPALVVMNHICAQENVTEIDLHNWAKQLSRIIPNGFDLVSIEPSMKIPKQEHFISFLVEEGHFSKVIVTENTKGQFRYPKKTKVVRISGKT